VDRLRQAIEVRFERRGKGIEPMRHADEKFEGPRRAHIFDT
jgi:hypothetical protein